HQFVTPDAKADFVSAATGNPNANVGIINVALACGTAPLAGVFAPTRRDRTEKHQHHEPQRSTCKSPVRRRSALERILRAVRASQGVPEVSHHWLVARR